MTSNSGKMIVLGNATPLIPLARCGLFDLLRILYGRIMLPPAVYREVVIEGRGRPGVQETDAAIAAGWIEALSLQDPEAARHIQATFLLGDGKSEVLALARERDPTLVLIDEQDFTTGPYHIKLTRRHLLWLAPPLRP